MAVQRKKTASKASSSSKAAGSKKQAARSSRPAGPASPDSMPAEVVEFITAIDEYKRKNQRPFPSWSEILDVVKGLGYRRSA